MAKTVFFNSTLWYELVRVTNQLQTNKRYTTILLINLQLTVFESDLTYKSFLNSKFQHHKFSYGKCEVEGFFINKRTKQHQVKHFTYIMIYYLTFYLNLCILPLTHPTPTISLTLSNLCVRVHMYLLVQIFFSLLITSLFFTY